MMSNEVIDTNWNTDLYDEKHAFVFKYGEDLVDVLKPQSGAAARVTSQVPHRALNLKLLLMRKNWII